METFKGEINEFVNWTSGKDERTNINVTQNKSVSGKSIRELIQKHLKKPFIKYDDVSGGQYIFFSSEEAKNEWLVLTSRGTEEDLEKASALPITTLTRPSDTAISVKSLDFNNNEGEISDSRYVISGDSTSEEANIRYVVRMSKDLGGTTLLTSDAFTVTYLITDATGNKKQVVEEYNSSMLSNNEIHPISFYCYNYLREGKNSILLTVKAKNSAASFETDISLYLIKFTLETSYDFARALSPEGVFNIPITITSSVSGLPLSVTILISDGQASNKVFVPVSNPSFGTTWSSPHSEEIQLYNTYGANTTEIKDGNEGPTHIKHTVRMWANLGTQFTSNVIYFTFETRSSNSNLTSKFINIKYDTPSNKSLVDVLGNVVLYGTQYEEFKLDWSYYTDHLNMDPSINVLWYLRYKKNDLYEEMLVGDGIGSKEVLNLLKFIPEIAQSLSNGASLVAKYVKGGQEVILESFPIIIAESSYSILETSGAVLKMSAFGKSNNSDTKETWIDPISGSTTTFTNMSWDDKSGWIDNSLQVLGVGTTAVIDYCPIPGEYPLGTLGKTIEIEFVPVKSNSDDDILIRIGNSTFGHIDIKPTGAYLYLDTNEILHTNYKVGERIKLAFVFNRTDGVSPSNNLVYIINNGILERAKGLGSSLYGSDYGNITIGGTNSIVRVYTIRAYNMALSCQLELNNFIFDSLDKSSIISRNQLYSNEQLDLGLVGNKIDTILIEGLPGQSKLGESYGGLTNILTSSTEKRDSETTVNITRTCISDINYSFSVGKAMIRKHGLSTINYPITSLKFWFNKSATVGDNPSWVNLPDYLKALNLNKNRYVMKAGAIPANKFVLQANYADSSGVHNGSLLRLINDLWYNANFGTRENPIYRLRTAPLLFTSGYTLTHDNESLNEDGSWVEGTYNITSDASGYDPTKVGKTWPLITGKSFPYKVRIGADSFPCAVFYNDPNGDGETHFLGQYVFMDDKKSDFIFGERSIYSFGDNTDPFVMNINNTKNGVNGKLDTAANRVWNNKDVLQIEIVLPNTSVTSYLSMQVPTSIELDDEGNIISTGGSFTSCKSIKQDPQTGAPLKYYWEDYFEMIYPDPDDFEDDKFSLNSLFNLKAKPFLDFLEWITSISAINTNTGTASGTQYTDGRVGAAALSKFKREAHDHLDLYKLAAYYIFFLRFGLVDSVERNAELKTYDGQHWHYEPWDMDIALGNTNLGALVLNPPLTRDSVVPGTSTKAFSGRSTSTSNFMWDCLEAWDYWMNTIVPQVSEALYDAGLTYDNIIKVFDEDYSDKWAESLYNEAGLFKYIKNGGGDYLPWLQGSRTSHRHWWLSTSMNYYDSKWSCGTFKEKRVVLFVDKGINSAGTDILTIGSTSSTFFELTSNSGTATIDRKEASIGSPAVFDISANSFSAKDPTWIFGGLFIEDLDLSCFARTMATVDVSRCYDNTLGANIKTLNIGIPLTTTSATLKTGLISGTQLRITAVNRLEDTDALERLETLNVTGQSSITSTAEIFNKRPSIKNFYASGTGLVTFENSSSGNSFTNLVLPASTNISNAGISTSLASFIMHDASWDNLEFWSTVATSTPTIAVDGNGDPIYVEDESGESVPLYNPASATYTKLTEIPSSINDVRFMGSTARNECSLEFILGWIESIKKTLSSYNNGSYNSDELHNALKGKSFRAENIKWTNTFNTMLTYEDLENIAYLNGVSPSGAFNNNLYKYIKGYVVLSDSLTTAQMIEVKKWFGDAAFDKSGISSLLVVDSISEDVIINIDGVTIENNTIELEEGNTASLLGTRFLLRDSVGNNKVISDALPPQVDEYIWAIGPTDNSVWGATYNSCRLQYNELDGRILLIAGEGNYGDGYDVKVKVSYRSDLGIIKDSYITVHIIGTKYPTAYNIIVSGTGVRLMYIEDDITRASYFPGRARYNNEVVDCYVLYSTALSLDIRIAPLGEFNANIKNVGFLVSELYPSAYGEPWYDFPSTNNQLTHITSDTYLTYAMLPQPNYAIRVSSTLLLPLGFTSYSITFRVLAGAMPYQFKAINIMLINDSLAIVAANGTSGLYRTLSSKYNADHTLPVSYNSDLFKTHLMGIEGVVDFTSNANLTDTLFTLNQDSVFKYLPNITEVDLEGCNIRGNVGTVTGGALSNGAMIDLSNCTKLTSLSLKDCNLSDLTGTISLIGALLLTTLNLSGTNLGVYIPENSTINSLALGNPPSVVIENPTRLTAANVTVDALGNGDVSNLTTVTLTNVSLTTLSGFSIFDKVLQLLPS